MKNVTYRFGTTGTLDNSQVHRLQLEGLFGPFTQVVSTYDLMEEGTVAKLGIHCLILNHPKQSKMTYQEEMDYLVSNEKRNKFIVNLVKSLKGNTLVLFQYVEKHGVVLYNMMQPILKEKLHYVYGGTDAKDREQVRGLVEKSRDACILASYGTFSTGINIRRIDNIVFASPSKSKIRNLQSIGRGLRISDDKTEVKLYDIADNLNGDNYTIRHLRDRINIYTTEGFDYQIHEIKL
jgi:superfamily II DNA or RNA helicase